MTWQWWKHDDVGDDDDDDDDFFIQISFPLFFAPHCISQLSSGVTFLLEEHPPFTFQCESADGKCSVFVFVFVFWKSLYFIFIFIGFFLLEFKISNTFPLPFKILFHGLSLVLFKRQLYQTILVLCSLKLIIFSNTYLKRNTKL